MPRVFFVTYNFLSAGTVFTDGFAHAAESLGIPYAHADWSIGDLPHRIKAFAPDCILVIHGRRFAGQWKKPLGAWTALYSLDDPYEIDEVATWAGRFDHVFVCDPGTLHRHKNASYLPTCYDPVVHRPDTRVLNEAVGFIGGGNATRERYLLALAQAGLLSYVIGGPWDAPAIQRLCRARDIPAWATADWYQQTQIVLNVFRERHHYNRQQIPATSLNPRIYEATMCGALVVSEWRPELDRLCPELPTFRTVGECVDLVAALVADPARVVSLQAACAARLAPHTYASRLQTVLQTCGLAVAA